MLKLLPEHWDRSSRAQTLPEHPPPRSPLWFESWFCAVLMQKMLQTVQELLLEGSGVLSGWFDSCKGIASAPMSAGSGVDALGVKTRRWNGCKENSDQKENVPWKTGRKTGNKGKSSRAFSLVTGKRQGRTAKLGCSNLSCYWARVLT